MAATPTLYTAHVYNPFTLFEVITTPDNDNVITTEHKLKTDILIAQNLPTLTQSQQKKLKQAHLENHTDELITQIIPRLDQTKDVKIFCKSLPALLSAEIKKQYKALSNKLLDSVELTTTLKTVLPQFDFNHIHPSILLQHSQQPEPTDAFIINTYATLLLTIFKYIQTEYIAKQQGDTKTTLARLCADAAITSIYPVDNVENADNIVKGVHQAQSMMALSIITLFTSELANEIIWGNKIAKNMVLLNMNEQIIDACVEMLLREQPSAPVPVVTKKVPIKKGKKAAVEQPPKPTSEPKDVQLLRMIFTTTASPTTTPAIMTFDAQLNQNVQIVAGKPALLDKTKEIITHISKLHDKLKKAQEKALKKTENDPVDPKKEIKGMLEKDTAPVVAKKTKEEIAEEKKIQQEEAAMQAKIIELNNNKFYQPTIHDIRYAVKQLTVGSIRFGVIQGIEANGIYIDTFQNHCKLRCFCPFFNVYDNKTIKKLLSADGLNPMANEYIEKTQRVFRQGEVQNLIDYKSNVIMKYANMQYTVGDRISFIICKIVPEENIKKENKNKQGEDDLQKALINVSFTNESYIKFNYTYNQGYITRLRNTIKQTQEFLSKTMLSSALPQVYDQVLDFLPPLEQEKYIFLNNSLLNDFSEFLGFTNMYINTGDTDMDKKTKCTNHMDLIELLFLKQIGLDYGASIINKIFDDVRNIDTKVIDDSDSDNDEDYDDKEELKSSTNKEGTSLLTNSTIKKEIMSFISSNKYTFQHYHIKPGMNNALFNSPTKQQQMELKTLYKSYNKKDFGAIYLQSLNFLRKIMSFQPLPQLHASDTNNQQVIKQRNNISKHFTHPSQFQRVLTVAEFCADSERYNYLLAFGTKFEKQRTHYNKIKGKVWNQIQMAAQAFAKQHPNIIQANIARLKLEASKEKEAFLAEVKSRQEQNAKEKELKEQEAISGSNNKNNAHNNKNIKLYNQTNKTTKLDLQNKIPKPEFRNKQQKIEKTKPGNENESQPDNRKKPKVAPVGDLRTVKKPKIGDKPQDEKFVQLPPPQEKSVKITVPVKSASEKPKRKQQASE